MKTIYIVKRSSGSYDDYCVENVRAWTSKDLADMQVAELQRLTNRRNAILVQLKAHMLEFEKKHPPERPPFFKAEPKFKKGADKEEYRQALKVHREEVRRLADQWGEKMNERYELLRKEKDQFLLTLGLTKEEIDTEYAEPFGYPDDSEFYVDELEINE